MARDDDEDVPWTRQLAVGAGVLVAVALVIGGVMSVVALGAAKVTGLGGAHASATARPSLYFPSDDPTTTPETFPDPNGSDEPSPSPSSSASPSAKPTQKTRAITLQAFPQQVPPNERINLTGVYQGGEGARLQVQRFENGWVDFPVSTSVSGGAFTTYIYTGRSGPNRFRVIDKEADKASNPVRVRVG
jgi:hypothetical protein